jgi:hypothetical protein
MFNKNGERLSAKEICVVYDDKQILEVESGYLARLEELLDLDNKNTPMKPIYPNEYPVPTCAVCGINLGDNKHCRGCGREIDWSDSNE